MINKYTFVHAHNVDDFGLIILTIFFQHSEVKGGGSHSRSDPPNIGEGSYSCGLNAQNPKVSSRVHGSIDMGSASAESYRRQHEITVIV